MIDWGRGGVGKQGKSNIDGGSYYRVREKPGTRDIPRNPQR